MIELIGKHRLDHAQLVCMRGDFRKQIANPCSTFAVLIKFCLRTKQLGTSFDKRKGTICHQLIRAQFHMPFFEDRFVIEGFVLRRRSGHVQVNDVLRFGRDPGSWRRLQTGLAKQLGHGQSTESHLAIAQKMPSRLQARFLKLQFGSVVTHEFLRRF